MHSFPDIVLFRWNVALLKTLQQLTVGLVGVTLIASTSVIAQTPSTPTAPSSAAPQQLTVDRIFASGDFRVSAVPQPHWLKSGNAYIDLRSANDGGLEIVRVDAVKGTLTVLAPASLVRLPNGKPLPIEDIELSADETKALIFHNSERVWRQNTKGQYTVIDFVAKRAIPIAPNVGAKLFAKLSPDKKSVAYVRENNLYLFDLASSTERPLTADGAANIINGTSDWVYEEEFDLRDGFRWSPDGKHIAFWRFDQTAVPVMTLMEDTDSLYPTLFQYKYPKAGQSNSSVRIGVVTIATNATTWMNIGDDATVYVPRMGWVGSDSLWIERMPRRQNRADLLMASIANGGTRPIMTDVDSAYVDVGDVIWINNYQQFLWQSDHNGWRQIYLYNRNGSLAAQVSQNGYDVLDIVGVDTVRKGVYAKVAAPNPTQGQIYYYSLDGKTAQRITRNDGSYVFDLAPGGKYASAVWSSMMLPPSSAIYELPSMKVVRMLGDNEPLKQRLAQLGVKPEFIKIPAADNSLWLDAYRIVPPGFDSTKKYPVMIYTYGGPATPQVIDSWLGGRFLFHLMLAQKGYVVVVADNRGAAWRGTRFRKMTQHQLGIIESDDQIAVARWIGQQTWGDVTRIGIWGWSYGGYNTAMSTFRGGDVFKVGISVAPVSDWRYYDSIYTERFMWIPQDNTAGYRNSSVMTHIAGLKAKYLLIHGLADDNVHPQNATVLAKALEYARKPFTLMFYPGKNHSISGPGGTLPLYDLLERYIRENL